MRMLHDPAVRSSLEERLATLRPDSPRKWGSMSADQMLWHVNQFLGAALSEVTLPAGKNPIPAPLLRFVVLRVPWPKSAPTNPGAVAKDAHDFETERALPGPDRTVRTEAARRRMAVGPKLRQGERPVREPAAGSSPGPPPPAVRKLSWQRTA